MDYEALRQQADLRLSQELTRIRNLPKKSKIKMVNTYGLKHASHTNAGLVQGLNTNLSIINREQRRVVNDLNKRRRAFASHCQRASLPPGLLAPLTDSEGGRQSFVVKQRKISERIKPDLSSLAEPGQSFREMKKGKLIAMAERSKSRTLSLIRSNSKKFAPIGMLSPLQDRPRVDLHDSFVTRLVNRKNRANTFKRSCFPSLLAGHPEVERPDHSTRGSRTFDHPHKETKNRNA